MSEEEGVPEGVGKILKEHGIFVPENITEDQQEVFQRAIEGFCMTCSSPLGDATMLIVVQQGVVGVFCGGACLGDMQVYGWLREQVQDLDDRIEFRGGGGDVAEE